MKLVLAEKPSVAQSIAKVLGAAKREDGYLEGNGYVVSWCVGHLVELAQPEVYDAKYSKWAYADLPIFPMDWQYEVSAGTKKQFGILKKLMAREDVASLVCATDAGREGELKLNGGDMKSVQGDSGHAQVKMVADVYSHIIDDDRRLNAERMEAAFYSGRQATPEPVQPAATESSADDKELLLKLLQNPEMAALLKSLAKTL